ncbi:MAG: isoprenylcysteine carboxyl methyltransferase family protein [Alphaproteobacteria bacterium]|nr:isoprenylcysteine carboxyl methyltransferase family protein [Alphaproteobacteria bacterium]
MVTSTALYLGLLAATGVERLAEVRLSLRHAAWSFARGGVEHGRGHYPAMVVLHTGFLVACAVEVVALQRPFLPWLGLPMLAVAAGCQALRWWCITTLGPRWNTRVIIVPGLPRITGGPYRWLSHPNYVAVVLEGLALPLIHTAWITALAFTVLNALLLTVRLRVENAALATLPPAAHPEAA